MEGRHVGLDFYDLLIEVDISSGFSVRSRPELEMRSSVLHVRRSPRLRGEKMGANPALLLPCETDSAK